VDRPLVAAVVERVNRLLSESGIRLRPAWLPESAALAGAVPVYLVRSKSQAASTPAAVPLGCRCVFVNPSVLSKWVSNNSKGTGRLKLDRSHFLVFVLLHEAGHLSKGTAAAVFERGDMSQLNIDPSKAKAAEEEADDFAVDLLRRYARQEKVDSLSLDANWVMSELTKLSWNMHAYRTLDEFGAFAVGKPSVFFDAGYSHPNLAWRILRANNQIHRSKDTQYLLDAFEDARRRGADPQPLYQRK
jgi:hypothetical protein